MEDYELDPSEVSVGNEVVLGGVKGTVENKVFAPYTEEYRFKLEGRKEVFTYPSSELGLRKYSVDNVYSPEIVQDSLDRGVSAAKTLSEIVESLEPEDSGEPVSIAQD